MKIKEIFHRATEYNYAFCKKKYDFSEKKHVFRKKKFALPIYLYDFNK